METTVPAGPSTAIEGVPRQPYRPTPGVSAFNSESLWDPLTEPFYMFELLGTPLEEDPMHGFYNRWLLISLCAHIE